MSREQVEQLVSRLEGEMRAAARNLEFERAAALRDELRDIRLRVLEEDASLDVARAAEAAARGSGTNGRSARGGDKAAPEASPIEVRAVEVLPAGEEPADLEPVDLEPDAGTAADWLPGIRDEHDDDGGWQARWLDRPTWDRRVTPNVIRRTGQRPARRAGRRR
jgi:hypothetical protein